MCLNCMLVGSAIASKPEVSRRKEYGAFFLPEELRAVNIIKSQILNQQNDGYTIRKYAIESNVTMFTSLDTVRVLLDVLDETTIRISTIDA